MSRKRDRQRSKGSLFTDELRGQVGGHHAGPEPKIPSSSCEQGRGDRAEWPTGGPRGPEQGEPAAGEPGDDAAKIYGERGLFLSGTQHDHEEQRKSSEPEKILEGHLVDRGKQTVDAEQIQNAGRSRFRHTDGRRIRCPGAAGEAAGSIDQRPRYHEGPEGHDER